VASAVPVPKRQSNHTGARLEASLGSGRHLSDCLSRWMSRNIHLDDDDNLESSVCRMGTSQANKARSKEKILDVAAERFRQDGLSGVSVAEIMRAAGLTHGGFYKHFESRGELVAEAVRRAVTPTGDGASYRSYRGFVRGYLSRAHRELRSRGCPMAALAGEVVRADDETRSAFTDGVRDAVAHIARLLRRDNEETDDARAAAAVSTAVGALVLSRAVDDPEFSDFLLASARAALLTG
jgi:TetR/AcrR family transcriptional regulator, transcriptional repressor for nem operon